MPPNKSATDSLPHRNKPKWLRLLGILLLLALVNWSAASLLLWSKFDALQASLNDAQWPLTSGGRQIVLSKSDDSKSKVYHVDLVRSGNEVAVEMEISDQDFSPLQLWTKSGSLHLASQSNKNHYWAEDAGYSDIQSAVRELAPHVPDVSGTKRFLGSVMLRPFITGVKFTGQGLAWKINTSKGSVRVAKDPLPLQANLVVGNWKIDINEALEKAPEIRPEKGPENGRVSGEELTAGLAESIRILGTVLGSAEPKADDVRSSGKGWMKIRNGHAQMFLGGTPYEIGFQHGSLDPEGVRKVCRRLVYGVGLLYSFKKGEWFPDAARKLVERQRPFIAPAYFEEMKGLAEGAGLPLDLIQMANIFPEFFHCSGVAVMGEATKGGELLHARVLDYMVGVGLQDHAAVMAISRPGVNRFVTVGYLGFIGSVTGMNEHKVAIGEMGGDGQGDWDGIPMSLLIRQSLEDCDTLEEVETFMRESPRTCEYYYVISDGKGPSALGVAATPEKFETFGPGVWHERLKQPVKDAVLLSGPGRYEALVKRVEEGYGEITRDNLIEIIKRPVAMKSNLHNVIFQPQSLQISVADAGRGTIACDEPYRNYTWDDLFSAAPSL